MSDDIFPVRYSQLSPNKIKNKIKERYKIGEPLSCRFFYSGLNDVYIIKTELNNYFLRISLTGVHKKCDYEEEIYIINTLSMNRIRVAAPVICTDGSYIWEINAPEGIRYAVLFEEAKKLKSDDDIKKSHNLGCMLAKLHCIADENNFKVSRTPIGLIQLVEKPLKLIKPYLAKRISDFKFLSDAASRLSMYIEENLSLEKPFYGYCHGDIHCENVYFNGEEPTIFDFDCMGYGWRIYDICVYAWNETGRDENYIEKESWHAFLDGYNSVRRLSGIELTSITAFAALRDLWLMGLHADIIERNDSCRWYNDSYFDYRIGVFKLWYNRFISSSPGLRFSTDCLQREHPSQSNP